MKSDQLMRLLIPDGKVKDVADATGLSQSLLYQERRPHGEGYGETGTRNTIERLDLFCELALSYAPNAVRLIGKRFTDLYEKTIQPLPDKVTLNDLLNAIAKANTEAGEALAAIGQRKPLSECEIEVEQAKEALELALRLIRVLESQRATEVQQ